MSPKKLAGLITTRREAARMTQEELARRAKNPSLLVPVTELLE
jgi:hypothetical protein